jgi:hypothetical protein
LQHIVEFVPTKKHLFPIYSLPPHNFLPSPGPSRLPSPPPRAAPGALSFDNHHRLPCFGWAVKRKVEKDKKAGNREQGIGNREKCAHVGRRAPCSLLFPIPSSLSPVPSTQFPALCSPLAVPYSSASAAEWKREARLDNPRSTARGSAVPRHLDVSFNVKVPRVAGLSAVTEPLATTGEQSAKLRPNFRMADRPGVGRRWSTLHVVGTYALIASAKGFYQ